MSAILGRLSAALADRYRVERELGAGGMATVYLAHDLKHEREVAIKVLHPDLAAALGGERFLSEIKTTAKLSHPHILPLLDSGSAEGFLFYVMPYVAGETLRGRLQRETQLPVADALRIASEVADALDAAHALGIVHRDIKPENILLQGAHALVADFGIALAVQSAGGARMTQTGLSLGTPQYMSPEQAMGDKQVDHRADIYALGAVTYEMLTGEPPHTGPSSQAIVAKLLTEAVRPVHVLRPSVAAHVDAALHVALEKLPADRFASVKEFSEALRGGTGARASTMMTSAMTPGPMTAGRRRLLVVGGVAIAAGALALGWIVGAARSQPGGTALELSVPLALTLAGEGTAGGVSLALSADGSMLAVGQPDSTYPSRMILHWLADQRRVELEPMATAPAFSPDGRSIAYFAPGTSEIRVLPVGGGTARTIVGSVNGSGLSWFDDSTLIFSLRDAGLQRITLGSGRRDTIGETASDTMLFGAPRVVTRDLILVTRGRTLPTAEVGVYSIRESSFRGFGLTGVRPLYVDPGIVVFLDRGTLWGVQVDPRTLARVGEPRTVVDPGASGRVVQFDASTNGVLVVRLSRAGSGRRLMMSDRAGLKRAVRPERALYRSVRFSPSGDRILYSEASFASLGGDIYIASTVGGNAVRVTTETNFLAPEWSRDGRRVMYATRPSAGSRGRTHILSVDAEGAGAVDTLLSRPNGIYEFELTADGRRLLWREDVGANARDVLSAAPGGGDSARAERATRFDERGIALSPDGLWYLYTSTETGRSEVYLSRLGGNGARWAVSRSGGSEPRWARNGEVFFRTQDSVYATRVVLGATPRVDPPRALFADDSYYVGFEAVWDVSPDGRRFVFVIEEGAATTALQLMVNWATQWRAGTR